jgi:MFS family permease
VSTGADAGDTAVGPIAQRSTTDAAVSGAVRTARVVHTAGFAVQGAVVALWGTRLPAVQHAAGLSTGQLAIVLAAVSGGLLVGLQLAGRWALRAGTHQPLPVTVCTLGGVLVLLGQCRTLAALAATAAVFGCALGALIVLLNSGAADVERAYGRPVMSTMHAAYSIAALGTAALAAASTAVPYPVAFAALGGTAACVALLAARRVRALPRLEAARPASTPAPQADGPAGRRLVWLLGALAAADLVSEGSATDWSAVHVHSLGATTGTAALAYTGYSLTVAAGRVLGDRLRTRLGPVLLVRTGALAAALGLAGALAADTVAAALAGWALLGAGLSTVAPTLYSAAGGQGPRAVALVATAGNLALLAGPAVIGSVAAASSLRTALLVPVLLTAGIAAAARNLGRQPAAVPVTETLTG